ncbi:hypothetical protein PHYBLDRAFT_161412 [Phycomyces blakesleeanus NRRL 1555(-)]|uniref:Uncharacterized protein n=1 Tax=Phycomyces blakesleeanus (strain ATCC 8743b / DSM 1359 / FGSC 10004 / NBRC 33097 / NRRL 1555) TaxID=763407 RepID=A0A162V8E9_PHYB8|nr:hypothetical protein PHYBLDRAFT_161412 [Phycomyces blakesleeanus NRRL 1555(-)]OAD80772.1 hypothetical protein PHYBLDRAFT_161412 [Phycomyces blakesleeanus NRRL 1555(-)]|eukprot:XP_018298812.1 hypothetical protein PHYBLDRAFT_161412 [Phycomyces blakesleeanus NRRL 1555(-)]
MYHSGILLPFISLLAFIYTSYVLCPGDAVSSDYRFSSFRSIFFKGTHGSRPISYRHFTITKDRLELGTSTGTNAAIYFTRSQEYPTMLIDTQKPAISNPDSFGNSMPKHKGEYLADNIDRVSLPVATSEPWSSSIRTFIEDKEYFYESTKDSYKEYIFNYADHIYESEDDDDDEKFIYPADLANRANHISWKIPLTSLRFTISITSPRLMPITKDNITRYIPVSEETLNERLHLTLSIIIMAITFFNYIAIADSFYQYYVILHF